MCVLVLPEHTTNTLSNSPSDCAETRGAASMAARIPMRSRSSKILEMHLGRINHFDVRQCPSTLFDVNRTENQYLSCSFCSSPAPLARLCRNLIERALFVWVVFKFNPISVMILGVTFLPVRQKLQRTKKWGGTAKVSSKRFLCGVVLRSKPICSSSRLFFLATDHP